MATADCVLHTISLQVQVDVQDRQREEDSDDSDLLQISIGYTQGNLDLRSGPQGHHGPEIRMSGVVAKGGKTPCLLDRWCVDLPGNNNNGHDGQYWTNISCEEWDRHRWYINDNTLFKVIGSTRNEFGKRNAFVQMFHEDFVSWRQWHRVDSLGQAGWATTCDTCNSGKAIIEVVSHGIERMPKRFVKVHTLWSGNGAIEVACDVLESFRGEATSKIGGISINGKECGDYSYSVEEGDHLQIRVDDDEGLCEPTNIQFCRTSFFRTDQERSSCTVFLGGEGVVDRKDCIGAGGSHHEVSWVNSGDLHQVGVDATTCAPTERSILVCVLGSDRGWTVGCKTLSHSGDLNQLRAMAGDHRWRFYTDGQEITEASGRISWHHGNCIVCSMNGMYEWIDVMNPDFEYWSAMGEDVNFGFDCDQDFWQLLQSDHQKSGGCDPARHFTDGDVTERSRKKKNNIEMHDLFTWMDTCKLPWNKTCETHPRNGLEDGNPFPGDLWCVSSESHSSGNESRVQICLEAVLPTRDCEGPRGSKTHRLCEEVDTWHFFDIACQMVSRSKRLRLEAYALLLLRVMTIVGNYTWMGPTLVIRLVGQSSWYSWIMRATDNLVGVWLAKSNLIPWRLIGLELQM